MIKDHKTQDLHENVGFYMEQRQRNKKTAQEQTTEEEVRLCQARRRFLLVWTHSLGVPPCHYYY